jgi:hypothetical protein
MDFDRLLSSRGAESVPRRARVCHQEDRSISLTITSKRHLLSSLSNPSPRTCGNPLRGAARGIPYNRLVSVHLVGNVTRGTPPDLRAEWTILQSRLLLRLLLHSCARTALLFFDQNIWMQDPWDHCLDNVTSLVIHHSRKCRAISKVRRYSTRSSEQINGSDVHDLPYSKTWCLSRSRPEARSGSRR